MGNLFSGKDEILRCYARMCYQRERFRKLSGRNYHDFNDSCALVDECVNEYLRDGRSAMAERFKEHHSAYANIDNLEVLMKAWQEPVEAVRFTADEWVCVQNISNELAEMRRLF